MGEIKEYKCPSCAKTWKLNIGCGLRHCELETVKRVFPEEMQKIIDEHTKEEKFPLFDFNVRPALCKSCGALVGAGVISIKGIVLTAPCPVCGGEAEVTKEAICPQCKSVLETKNIGYWD